MMDSNSGIDGAGKMDGARRGKVVFQDQTNGRTLGNSVVSMRGIETPWW